MSWHCHVLELLRLCVIANRGSPIGAEPDNTRPYQRLNSRRRVVSIGSLKIPWASPLASTRAKARLQGNLFRMLIQRPAQRIDHLPQQPPFGDPVTLYGPGGLKLFSGSDEIPGARLSKQEAAVNSDFNPLHRDSKIIVVPMFACGRWLSKPSARLTSADGPETAAFGAGRRLVVMGRIAVSSIASFSGSFSSCG